MFLIKYLLQFSQEYAIMGAGIATVASRLILLGILVVSTKNKFNLSVRGIDIRKPIFATLVMALFL